MNLSVLLVKKDPNGYDEWLKKAFDHFYHAANVEQVRTMVNSVSLDAIIWDADFDDAIPYSYFRKIAYDKIIVLLISDIHSADLKTAMNSGLRFCLDKRDGPLVTTSSIIQICQICKNLKKERALLNRYTVSDNAREILFTEYNLSNREIEVVNHALDSSDYGQIASKLYISKGTVKRHLHNIYQKTNIRSRAQLKHFVYGLNTVEISSFQNFYSMT